MEAKDRAPGVAVADISFGFDRPMSGTVDTLSGVSRREQLLARLERLQQNLQSIDASLAPPVGGEGRVAATESPAVDGADTFRGAPSRPMPSSTPGDGVSVNSFGDYASQLSSLPEPRHVSDTPMHPHHDRRLELLSVIGPGGTRPPQFTSFPVSPREDTEDGRGSYHQGLSNGGSYVPESAELAGPAPVSRVSGGRGATQPWTSTEQRVPSPNSKLNRNRESELSSEERELLQCTFHPTVRPSGPHFSVPFYDRVRHWQKKREEDMKQKAEELGKKDVEECTFRPSLNPGSVAIIKEKQRNGEDLHRQRESRKQKIEDTIKQQQEEEFRKLCTFQPRLVIGSAYAKRARSKYLEDAGTARGGTAASAGNDRDEAQATGIGDSFFADLQNLHRSLGLPLTSPARPEPPTGTSDTGSYARAYESAGRPNHECTFTPHVNKPKGKHLQNYLQQPAHERLSRSSSRPSSAPLRGGIGLDRDIAMAVGHTSSSDDLYPSSAEARLRLMLVEEFRGASEEPAATASARHEHGRESGKGDFDQFLSRQKVREKAKKEKIEMLKLTLQSSHKPQINQKSVEMITKNGDTDFLKRQQRSVSISRAKQDLDRSLGGGQGPGADNSLSGFDPHAATGTASSRKKFPARSLDELSYGDAMRRKARIEQLRLEAEQRELEGVTFQPQLIRRASPNQGRLRIVSDSETFLDRLREERSLKQEKIAALARERERKELENCTFQPEIHDAPDYVKRIARALSLSKRDAGAGAGQAHADLSRREWV